MQHKSNRYKKFCLSSKKSLILLTINNNLIYNAKIYAKTISEVTHIATSIKIIDYKTNYLNKS